MPFGPILLIPALLSPGPFPAMVGQGASLSAAATASGRPSECMSSSKRALAKGPSIWELARVPTLQHYCDLMARAHAELPTMPESARRAAEEADRLLPGHAAPAVVLARAALAVGAIDEAARAFERARAVEPRSVEDPATMHDLARVLVKTGKRDEALTLYRALVTRVDLLSSTDRRVSVLLEAAHVSMASEGMGGAVRTAGELVNPERPTNAVTMGRALPIPQHRARLDEAIAYLREARQRPPTQLVGDVLLSLALALDRAGAKEEADATMAEAERAGARLRTGALEYLATAEDRAALEALAIESSDRAAAQKAWESYLAGPAGKGAWAAAARARLDALRKGGAKTAGRKTR